MTIRNYAFVGADERPYRTCCLPGLIGPYPDNEVLIAMTRPGHDSEQEKAKMRAIEHAETARVEASPEARRIGALLDHHHAPESNGRMAVCRRCGAGTDGPWGGHAPSDKQLGRSDEWLKKVSVDAKVAEWRRGGDT